MEIHHMRHAYCTHPDVRRRGTLGLLPSPWTGQGSASQRSKVHPDSVEGDQSCVDTAARVYVN